MTSCTMVVVCFPEFWVVFPKTFYKPIDDVVQQLCAFNDTVGWFVD